MRLKTTEKLHTVGFTSVTVCVQCIWSWKWTTCMNQLQIHWKECNKENLFNGTMICDTWSPGWTMFFLGKKKEWHISDL